VTACARCRVKAARGQRWINWRPDLCGDCAEAVKHPSMRRRPPPDHPCVRCAIRPASGDPWRPKECVECIAARRDKANRMLAEVAAYQFPADWLHRAAAHCADPGESPADVLRRWAQEDEP
jgi:hypothetical protein